MERRVGRFAELAFQRESLLDRNVALLSIGASIAIEMLTSFVAQAFVKE